MATRSLGALVRRTARGPQRSDLVRLTRAMPKRERAAAEEVVVDVKGLSIGWDDVVLQKDLTFSVKRGEVFAILGGSGTGKSTLLRFLVGLEPPMAGELDIAGRGPPDLDAGLPPFGVMFQGGALFGALTVGENVSLPLEEWTDLPDDAIAAIARRKLKLVGLDGAADKFPSELSGGMRKRVGLARALMLEPPILVYDEPTSGLDPLTSRLVDDLIEEMRQRFGVTSLVISHDIASCFRIAHQAILLIEGRVEACGTPDELMDGPSDVAREFIKNSGVDTSRLGRV